MSDQTQVIRTFQSLSEFTEHIRSHPHIQGAEKSANDWSYSQVLTHSLEEALDLSNGWDAGVSKIDQFSAPIVDAISSRIERLDPVYDIEGMSIDVARFVQGEPECWQRFEPTIVDGRGSRLLTVVVNLGTSCGIHGSDMVKRGTFICATIQCLELAGFAVEVIGVDACTNRKDTSKLWDIQIRLKASDQPLDMAHLAFALAHPSMHRRLFCTYLERDKDFTELTHASYGCPTLSPLKGDIVFPEHFMGESFPPFRLIQILKDQGVHLLNIGDNDAK